MLSYFCWKCVITSPFLQKQPPSCQPPKFRLLQVIWEQETSFLKWKLNVNHLYSVDVVFSVEKERMVRIIIEDMKEFLTLLSVESNPRLLWFRFTSLFDWLIEFTPPSQPMRIITKSNRNLVTNLKVNWHFFFLFFFLFFRFFSSDNWNDLDDKFWSNFSNNSLSPFRYSLLFTLFTTPGFIFHEKTTRGFRFQLSLRTLIRGFFQSLIFFFLMSIRVSKLQIPERVYQSCNIFKQEPSSTMWQQTAKSLVQI